MDTLNSQIEVKTDQNDYLSTAEISPPYSRIPVEIRVVVEDPFESYVNSKDGSPSFFLETTGATSGWGYFGINPSTFLEIDQSSLNTSSTLSQLHDLISKERLIRNKCEVPYPCAAVGWLSYALSHEIEQIPINHAHPDPFPLVQIGLYDCIVSWKEPRDGKATLRITSCPPVEDPEKTFEMALKQASDMAHALQTPSLTSLNPPVPTQIANFQSSCGRDNFYERVRKIKNHITEGDTFQVNTAHHLSTRSNISPDFLFRVLREINPAPYSALLEFPDIDLIGVSPELLFRLENNLITAEPIAGTRPRGSTPSEDSNFEKELLQNPKELAEHAMLVDLCRNDIGKVAKHGTVAIDEYCRVDRYSAVMHLVSTVQGHLQPNKTVFDIIQAMFPGGTITGAPKPRTMEIINTIENSHRGPYTGSIGIFGFDNRATLNIIIRTFIHHKGVYLLPVGSGIVHDSSPEDEYEETLSKAKALVEAMNLALSDSSYLK